MEFEKRLVELRKERNLYQVDVAKKIGVARATYGAYEQGNRQPDFDTLEKIANLYGVTTDYLLGRSDNPRMTADEEFKAFSNDPNLKHFFRDIEASSEQEQEELKAIFEIIKKRRKEKEK